MNYRQMARSLDAEAKRHEAKGRPLHAAKLRHQARLAMRAAWAEEENHPPQGVGE